MKVIIACLACLGLVSMVYVHAAATDIDALWIRGQPQASEARMRSALAEATDDDARLMITSQIARTYVFRKQFERAREALAAVEPLLAQAGAEAQAHYWLELGRTYASHQHARTDVDQTTRDAAREAFDRALATARVANLQSLAIDALHMQAFVDPGAAQQIVWNERALKAALAADQANATRWEASIRNNLGENLVELARYREALPHFRRALLLRQRAKAPPAIIRDAGWQVGRVLRLNGELREALAVQIELADESLAAGTPKPYIYRELALLYAALGDQDRAAHFSEHRQALVAAQVSH
ncbi:MAG: hypothetical protein AAGA68_16130 [Pseudomonadota bacterium]